MNAKVSSDSRPIWSRSIDLVDLNTAGDGNMIGHLGIVFTESGDDWLAATMPVDERTRQPFGLLHGGASAALAETLASIAGVLVAGEDRAVVGVEINASHVRKVSTGRVTGVARPDKLGRGTHIWSVRIHDGAGDTVCVSRVPLRVLTPA